MSDEIRIDFRDGISALDRTMRAITMIAAEAIGRLTTLGWNRKSVSMEIGDDPLPCWVTVRKRRVFEIKTSKQGDGTIRVQGEWIDGPKGPGIIERFMGH